VFRRDALWEFHRSAPTLGFAVTWLTAQEESLVDDALLSVGRCSAEERIATLLVLLFKRMAALLPDAGAGGVPFPLTHHHIADGLGLSLVHTNRTLRKLERRGLHRIEDGRLHMLDVKGMARIADLYGDGKPSPRPLSEHGRRLPRTGKVAPEARTGAGRNDAPRVTWSDGSTDARRSLPATSGRHESACHYAERA
jgi:hypothetical protein